MHERGPRPKPEDEIEILPEDKLNSSDAKPEDEIEILSDHPEDEIKVL